MAVINRRSRLVNFRLSEQELEALKAACYAQGARSISDFARGAVLRSTEPKNGASPETQAQMSHLDEKVADLEMRISLLYRLLEHQYRSSPDGTIRLAQTA